MQSQLDKLNPIIYLLYALLAMSVIISLFGIVNTLVLSIFERTREIGMLRAIGLSRRQMRRMVRYESVITSVIGGILGTIVGLFFGWVMAKGLENQGIQFAVPVGQLVIFLIVCGDRRRARGDPARAARLACEGARGAGVRVSVGRAAPRS